MKNNKGFSLVELIIVIALMGIILGFASVGLGALSSQNEKAASKDIYNMIGSAKTVAMSRAECYLVLTSDSVRIVYKNTENSTYITASENSIKKTVLVSYSEDGTNYSQIDGSTTQPGIVIKFDRSTGGFDSFYYYNTAYTSGGSAVPYNSSYPISNIRSIKVGDGDKAIYITLTKSTGKYSLE